MADNDPQWDINWRFNQWGKVLKNQEKRHQAANDRLKAQANKYVSDWENFNKVSREDRDRAYEDEIEKAEEDWLSYARDSGEPFVNDVSNYKRRRLEQTAAKQKPNQLLEQILNPSDQASQAVAMRELTNKLGGFGASREFSSSRTEQERDSLFKAGTREAREKAVQGLIKKAGGEKAEEQLLRLLANVPEIGWVVRALMILKKPWVLGLQLVITLILVSLIVFLIATLFNAYSGRSGTTPTQAGDINDDDFIDRLTLQKCLDEKPIQVDEEQQASSAGLSIECQKLIEKLETDGTKEIASLRSRIESFEDDKKAEALEKLGEMESALNAVKNSNGTIETLKQAIKFEEKRQEFLTAFYSLIGCDNVEAIFKEDPLNPGFYATPEQPVGNLARYRNGSYDSHEWYVTKDFACYLIKVSQAFGADIELGEGSGRGGTAATGHNTHSGGGVMDIWVQGFHSGSTPARARELAKIIMDLGARYLIVGSYQQSLEDIQGVDSDPSGIHDNHWHICFSGC
ncbi:hypothetical protein KC644_02745 [Candidatus Berkelbacteria bacterium]|nr:hypothetical protein [Candidatus Berkelbacteria bacterium]